MRPLRQIARAASLMFAFAAPACALAAGHPKDVSPAGYREELVRLRGVVTACENASSACNPDAVGADLQVRGVDGNYTIGLDWLRDTLQTAKHAPESRDNKAERMAEAHEALQTADARLQEDAAGADGSVPAPPTGNLREARARANAVFARKEFRGVQGESYLALKVALFFAWLHAMLAQLGGLLPHSAFAGEALVWSILLLAAAGLLLWAFRVLQRGRVELTARVDAGAAMPREEAERWAERAEAEAARGEWREAIHCLYWAAISMGEGQGLWRRNRARTPREYVRLLEPGSERQTSLRRLTAAFERIWYGVRAASETDYREARSSLDRMRAG